MVSIAVIAFDSWSYLMQGKNNANFGLLGLLF